MTTKNDEETKPPRWLHALGNFFVNAFTSIELLFGRSKSTLPEVNNGNTVNVGFPLKEERENITYNKPDLLIVPADMRDKFARLASTRPEASSPLLNHAGNHSTLALLNINNVYFRGVNNVESTLTPRDLNDLRATLKYEQNFPAYAAFLVHPEADAILKAFKQRMTADRATMFIDRRQCNTCGRKEYNATYLRRLLPVLRLKELTIYTTNSIGKITKLVLSPLSTGTSHQNFW